MQIATRLVEPLTKGFQKEYKWWSGVELARRLIILIFITAFPANNVSQLHNILVDSTVIITMFIPLQYPAIFILSIFMLIIGYVKPYSDKSSNYIELFLGINVLILLLLRNTEQLNEELKHIPLREGEKLKPLRKCVQGVEVEGASRFAWLLFVLYYLPLLAALFGIAMWSALWSANRIRYVVLVQNHCYSNMVI